MGGKKSKPGNCDCPVGKFFEILENGPDKTSSFYKHMNRSKLEFLKAIRTLVDERIDDLEKKAKPGKKKKVKKIKIE